tara:strand:+ start:679 stop:1449 length:771 start_codon:yes stop_codon:yes gene_type:complete
MIFKKLFTSIKIRIYKIFNKNRGYFDIAGKKMFLDFLDPIDREIIISQKYEEEEINILKKLYNDYKYEYFLDIGANCGYYCIKLSSEFNKLKLIAFEPNKEAFLKLSNTLDINPKLKERIKIHNFGLSNSSAQKEMTSLEKYGYLQSGGSTIINKDEKKFIKTKIFLCDFKVGNEVLNFKNKNICIKIDVEGHEYQVIDGIKKLLKENKVIIQIEISDKKFEKMNLLLKDLKFIFFEKVYGREKWIANYYYKNFDN